jgi:hypothetical protein
MENLYDDKWDNPAYVAAVKANIRNNANKTFMKSYERAEEVSDYLERVDYELQKNDRKPVSFLEKLSASLREYGKLSPKQYQAVCKIIDDQQDKREALQLAIQQQKDHSQALGVKTERIQGQVTVEKIITVKAPRFSRYDSDEAYIYIFRDVDNNRLVLKTKNILSNTDNYAWDLENPNAVKEGDTVVIKASIKAHTEYKGEKQTLIQRVKIMETK